MNNQFIFIILLILHLKLISTHNDTLSRRLGIRDKIDPVPIFEAFRPNGLKISIPNVAGLEIFGFHANLNKPINIRETGEYHNDIISSENGNWTYYIKDIELRIGDVLNYWIYLQMDGNGEQFSKKRYVITNLIHLPTASKNSSIQNLCSCSDFIKDNCTTNISEYQSKHEAISSCNQAQLIILENKIYLLENQLESLIEVVNDLMKDLNIGTEMILTGIDQENFTALDILRDVLINQLDLIDLPQKVVKAEYISNGILFRMSSSADKKRTLFRALKCLKKSKYKIIDSEVGTKTQSHSAVVPGLSTQIENTKTLIKKLDSDKHSEINRNEMKMTNAELSASGVSDIFDIDIRLGSN